MKKIIIAVILFYRKFISKTLYKNVRCSFEDSCSTYALRVAKNENFFNSICFYYKRWLEGRGRQFTSFNIRGYLVWGEGYDQLNISTLDNFIINLKNKEEETEEITIRIISNMLKIYEYQRKYVEVQKLKK